MVNFKLFTVFLAIGAIILFGLSLTSALKPEYNSLTIPFNYVQSVDKDSQTLQNVSLDIPGGIKSITSMTLELYGDWGGGIVQGILDTNNGIVYCDPNYWITPKSSESYRLRFDCTNVSQVEFEKTKKGKKDNKGITFSQSELFNFNSIGFQTNKKGQNIYGELKITYLDKGEPIVKVHGTEYTYGIDSIAKAWLQLLNSSGDYINDGICYVDIYSPAGEEYIEHAVMTRMNHDGIYYYDTPVPIGKGVYPVIAQCYYEATQNDVVASSYSIYEGEDRSGGHVERTWEDNGDNVEIKTKNNVRSTNQLDVNYTFDDFYGNCSGIDENLLSSMSVYWKGTWETGNINHDINVYFWNYTSGEYVELPNKINGGNGGTVFPVTNSLDVNNITKALGITATQPLIVRYNDTLNTEGKKKFKTRYTYAGCDELANPEWQEVKGSSELHITSDHKWNIEVTSGEVKNDTFPDFFYYNFTIESAVEINTEDEEVHVTMPEPFSCHHIKNVTVDGVNYNMTLSNAENDADTKGCKVAWDMDLNVSQNYQGQIIADNWFKEVEATWLTEMELQHAGVELVCENYRVTMGYPNYTLPRPDTENPFSPTNRIDELYDVCYAYLDNYYHYNQSFFNEFYVSQATFNEEQMLYLNNLYSHFIEGRDELNIIATSILNTMNAIGTYSTTILADPNNLTKTNWSQVYATISSSYINLQEIQSITNGAINVSVNTSGIADDVWNYSDRQLTSFTFFNASTIAQAVWSYTGSIVSNILDAFTSNIWSYNNRTLTESPSVNVTEIANGVWNNDNRNLTSFDFVVDTTNYNLTEQNVWEYAYRNLTYYPATTDETNYSQIQQIVIDYGNNNTDLTNYTLISELVDNASTTDLISDIWNFTNRSIDAFPSHQYLGGTEYFASGEGKISVRLVQAQGGNSSTETGADCNITILYPNNTIFISSPMIEYGDGVYTYDFTVPSNTLGVYTYYSNCEIDNRSYFGLNTFHVWDINETKISQDVWGYNVRELTSAEDVTNYSRIQDETWNASTRELTYYPTTNITLSNDSIQELGDAVWEYNGTISQNILTQFATKVQCYIKNIWEVDTEWGIDISSC